MSQDEIQIEDTDDVAGHRMADRVMVRKQSTGLSTGALGGQDDVEGHGLRTEEIGGRRRVNVEPEPVDEDDTEGHVRSF